MPKVDKKKTDYTYYRCRNWSFTVNNYTTYPAYFEGAIWSIQGKEKGEEKATPHIQGFVSFKERKSHKQVMKFIPGGWAANKIPHSTFKNNREYCIKEGTDIFETGAMPEQGKRTDLHAYRDAIKAKTHTRADLMDDFPAIEARYPNYKTAVRMAYQTNKAIDVKTYVYWGLAGTGKSTLAYKGYNPDDFYIVDHGGSQVWWNNYQGQGTIIFDDFYGGITFHMFLRWTHRWQCPLNVKCSQTTKQWHTVIFTSNHHPDTWYPNISDMQRKAFNRRLTTVREFTEDDIVEDYKDPVE